MGRLMCQLYSGRVMGQPLVTCNLPLATRMAHSCHNDVANPLAYTLLDQYSYDDSIYMLDALFNISVLRKKEKICDEENPIFTHCIPVTVFHAAGSMWRQ